MVNYISHNQPMFVAFSDRYLAEGEALREKRSQTSMSQKRFNVSYSGMSAASTAGSEAELTPRSEGEVEAFDSQLNVIFEKGESMYEPAQRHYTEDQVDDLRAKLDAKAREIEAEGDKIESVMAKADGV